MKGRLKVMLVLIFFFLVISLTAVLAMPYEKLDWENYAGAYGTPSHYVYLPLTLRQ